MQYIFLTKHYYGHGDLLFKCLVQQLLNLTKVLLETQSTQQLLFHDHVEPGTV